MSIEIVGLTKIREEQVGFWYVWTIIFLTDD
jgi:hypothetical protein